MKIPRRTLFRYSEAFKEQVIREVEEGLMSHSKIRRKYGIRGYSTIHEWLKKRGKFDLLSKRIRVEKPDEIDRIKELEKQIRQLKEALADSHVREVISETR